MAITQRLYEALVAQTGRDVSLEAVEADFGFALAPVWVADGAEGEGGAWRDPYSSRVLAGEVEASWSAFLEALCAACAALPGIDPSEAAAADAWAAT